MCLAFPIILPAWVFNIFKGRYHENPSDLCKSFMRNWNYLFELSNSDAIVIDPLDDVLINEFVDKNSFEPKNNNKYS